MPTTVRLTREGFGIELRRGRFEVDLDGQHAGFIEYHETTSVLVDPGHHTLRIKRGRYSSPARNFDVADRETAVFRCHGANLWPVFVASLVKPDLAISLHRE